MQHSLSERGVTLVELMFGLTISMVLMGAAYTVMKSSIRASTLNDQTAGMQQNARMAMELVTRDLKMAGFGMSGTVGGCNTAVVPTDNNTGGADTGPDRVLVVVPTVLSTLKVTATGGPAVNTITLQDGAVAAMTPDGFAAGAPISIGGVVAFTVGTIAGDVLTLNSNIAAPRVFRGCVQPCAGATQVYWLRCVRYDIATTTALCEGSAPCLRRGIDPGGGVAPTMVAIAEGIEDLQLAYACDGCNGTVPDGVVDDQNASNTFDTADFISNSAWATVPATPDSIRMVRVSIVARQTLSDPEWGSTAPIVAEDHNPTQDAGYSAATYEHNRRRLLTRTVQLRNVGL
jgi:type IV pilus assembly protein PilW